MISWIFQTAKSSSKTLTLCVTNHLGLCLTSAIITNNSITLIMILVCIRWEELHLHKTIDNSRIGHSHTQGVGLIITLATNRTTQIIIHGVAAPVALAVALTVMVCSRAMLVAPVGQAHNKVMLAALNGQDPSKGWPHLCPEKKCQPGLKMISKHLKNHNFRDHLKSFPKQERN